MSSYFDEMNRKVRDADQIEDDGDFLWHVRTIEEQVFADVSIVTGDREFPDDLRQQIMAEFAVHGIWQPGDLTPTPNARDYVAMMRMSKVIDLVHERFHELARRRVVTRFGLLSDSPTQIRVLRDDHDSPDQALEEGEW
ncbi:MAG: hypothetical protein GY825_05530 [Phycisphaeraceae bacterium]|nr:hypothetical protein [Phycisphaeraceae bacterium]